VLFDPEMEMKLSWKNLHMRVDYSPYEERTVRGWPTHVLSRGEVIIDEGRFTGKKGAGRFLKRGRPQV
jgi:dihydropyrimidinase